MGTQMREKQTCVAFTCKRTVPSTLLWPRICRPLVCYNLAGRTVLSRLRASIICLCLKVHVLVYTNGHAGVQVRSREARYYSKQYLTQK